MIVVPHRRGHPNRCGLVPATGVERARDLPLLVKDVAHLLQAAGRQHRAVERNESLAVEVHLHQTIVCPGALRGGVLDARREASARAQRLSQRRHEVPLDHVEETAGDGILPVEELPEQVARHTTRRSARSRAAKSNRPSVSTVAASVTRTLIVWPAPSSRPIRLPPSGGMDRFVLQVEVDPPLRRQREEMEMRVCGAVGVRIDATDRLVRPLPRLEALTSLCGRRHMSSFPDTSRIEMRTAAARLPRYRAADDEVGAIRFLRNAATITPSSLGM